MVDADLGSAPLLVDQQKHVAALLQVDRDAFQEATKPWRHDVPPTVVVDYRALPAGVGCRTN